MSRASASPAAHTRQVARSRRRCRRPPAGRMAEAAPRDVGEATPMTGSAYGVREPDEDRSRLRILWELLDEQDRRRARQERSRQRRE
jgi:hypothetical protein